MLSATSRRMSRRVGCSWRTTKALTTSSTLFSSRQNCRPQSTCRRPTNNSRTVAMAASSFSTTTASTAAAAAPVRDFFLDNLGKFFLGTIALVIGSLVRSSYGTSNMKQVREELEEQASLDPLEIDELRQANSELTPEVFRIIVQDLFALGKHQNNDGGDDSDDAKGSMTYPEFVRTVRQTLQRVKGEGCTIGMGHLLDRVVIAVLQDKLGTTGIGDASATEPTTSTGSNMTEESFSSSSDLSTANFAFNIKNNNSEVSMPISFWLTVLSLALNGSVPDRIRILYEVLEMQSTANNNSSNNNIKYDLSLGSSSSSNEEGNSTSTTKVTLQDVTTMVQHLQDTCQLVPDTQVVPTETKYPTQQYRRGTPQELVKWEEAAETATNNSNSSSSSEECLDLDAFAGILRTRSVCAWGECYHKKKFVT